MSLVSATISKCNEKSSSTTELQATDADNGAADDVMEVVAVGNQIASSSASCARATGVVAGPVMAAGVAAGAAVRTLSVSNADKP